MLVGIISVLAVILADACSPVKPGCAECDSTGKACTKCDAGGATPYLKKADPSDPTGTCVTVLGCAYDNEHYADNSISSSGTKECKVCNGGKRPDTAGTKCVTCSDANCKRCDQDNVCARCNTGEPPENGACPVTEKGCHSSCDGCTSNAMTNQADKCTGCKGDNYLIVVASNEKSGVCVSAAACTFDGLYFTKEVTDSNGSKKMCLPCNDATHGIADCKKCILKTPSAQAEPTLTCSDCDTKWLSPLGDACLDGCPDGTYSGRNNDNIGICAPCHNSCASCGGTNAETSCTSCYPGAVLSRTNGDTGKCIPECTGGFTAHCKAGGCSLNVGGSKYCDQCEDGYAPIDGVCTEVSSTARDASGCKASGGKCTTCSGSYALLSGGCYDTNRVPGNSVCEMASAGQCTMCVSTNKDPKGSPCPTCSEGCEQCAADTNQCEICYPGYYRTGTGKCFKCAANGDNGIKGVPNCVSCAPPAGGSGSVTCYVKMDGTSGGDDGNGGSVNRSGLSTGAIAGIAVAVVIVVGGLVGFLCWWFLCRGKA
ncbi:VSP with INR [Giardia lamblia P15]|uniref:VSP with INR n=1 Tax=Giardia intestinalis (strain P15) TaxID=658858 RepID=E1F2Z8_GIAIA|nr:VSP with INR [Giardia lamblia P15]